MEQTEAVLQAVSAESVVALPSTDHRPFLAGGATISRFELVALASVLATALGIRLVWIHVMPVPPESDFATFLQMAQAIARGQWPAESYGWTYQGPGYPLLLSPLLYLGNGLFALRIANVAFQLGMVLSVWLIGRRSFGPGPGLAGAAIAAILPGLWAYTPLVAAENLAVLLISILVLTLGAQRPWAAGLAGICAAALAYTRPAYLAMLPVLALVALVWLRISWRRFGWYAAGAAVIVLPLAALNVSHDGPALPGGAAGLQLWLTNNERATGSWFPAAESDDYPFKGLDSNGGGADLLSSAERKLGLQFVYANPQQSVRWAAKRHRIQWTSDSMGAYWTVDRAPAKWKERVPLAEHLAEIFDRVYFAVLALAAVGVVQSLRRPASLIPILVPLAYVLPLFALAEANGRYHAIVLPLLCVLAGAALVPVRRAIWSIPLAALTAWLGPGRSIGALLILFVVLVPAAALLVRTLPSLAGRWSDTERRIRPIAIASSIVVIAVMLALGINRMADRALAELAAVQTNGWRAYLVPPRGQAEPKPLTLVDSGTRPGMREVSYPDGVALQFADDPVPGEVLVIVRTLPHLEPGTTYQFYLQVYDPGPDADPSETLTVTLNDRTVWQRGPGEAAAAGWQYLSIPWAADGSAVTIRVERRAGTNPEASGRAAPVVRTLHLYPKY